MWNTYFVKLTVKIEYRHKGLVSVQLPFVCRALIGQRCSVDQNVQQVCSQQRSKQVLKSIGY